MRYVYIVEVYNHIHELLGIQKFSLIRETPTTVVINDGSRRHVRKTQNVFVDDERAAVARFEFLRGEFISFRQREMEALRNASSVPVSFSDLM